MPALENLLIKKITPALSENGKNSSILGFSSYAINFGVNSIANQVTAYLNVNGLNVSSTNTSNKIYTGKSEKTINFYVFTEGNANYTATTLPIEHIYVINPLYYVPITIHNKESVPTPSPFQQSINLNASKYSAYENSNLSNVEFYYANGTVIPSWLQGIPGKSQTLNLSSAGNALYWLKLDKSIPANGTMTIYMGFASTSTNLLNNKDVGEAPNLSPTYAEYDDGNDVFNFYSDFKGNSINTTKWKVYNSTQLGIVNNSLTINLNSNGAYILYSNETFPENSIIENDFSFTTSDFPANIRSSSPSFSTSNTITNLGADSSSSPIVDWSLNSANSRYWNAQQGDSSGYFSDSTGSQESFSNSIWGIAYTGSVNTFYWNNDTEFTSSSSYSPEGNVYAVIGANYGNLIGNGKFVFHWVRVRAYPPNGIMPSASFGKLNDSPFLYLSENPLIYGETTNITAIGRPNNDTVKIEIDGNTVAEGTGILRYTTQIMAAGTYNITVFDVNKSTQNTEILEIGKAVPNLDEGNSGAYIGNYSFTFSSNTISNQLKAYLYIDNSTVSNTSTTGEYNIDAFGNYSAYVATAGNQNYTPHSYNTIDKEVRFSLHSLCCCIHRI